MGFSRGDRGRGNRQTRTPLFPGRLFQSDAVPVLFSHGISGGQHSTGFRLRANVGSGHQAGQVERRQVERGRKARDVGRGASGRRRAAAGRRTPGDGSGQ